MEAEMNAELAAESAELSADAFPVEVKEFAPGEDEIEVTYCGLVWVPYWRAADGRRRRAF